MSEREEINERIRATEERLRKIVESGRPWSPIEQALDDGERKDRERKPRRDERDEVGWV